VNWFAQQDGELSRRFAHETLDTEFTFEIVKFCRICLQAIALIDWDDASDHRDEVQFLYHKWRIRSALYTGRLPNIEEPPLPEGLRRELDHLRILGKSFEQDVLRLDLADPSAANLAHEILLSIRDDDEPREEVLTRLASRNLPMGSFFEVSLAGYEGYDEKRRRSEVWGWAFRISLPTLEVLKFRATEAVLPARLSKQLHALWMRNEEINDSTNRLLVA